MPITLTKARRVRAVASIDLPLPASAVWGQMRDARRFLTLDPLHQRIVTPESNDPLLRKGDRLRIPHRLAGVGPDRVGRVLRWDEGRGYAISDLSRRGPTVGFPHICAYRLDEVDAERCRLQIKVVGRWTGRWAPRPLVRAWLLWVMSATERRITAEMKALARRRRCSLNPAPAHPPPSP